MVNMYSMGMMNPIYSMMQMNSSTQSGENVHQQLKNKYGIGYSAFGNKPYVQGYPFGILAPEPPEPPVKSFLKRIYQKFYA